LTRLQKQFLMRLNDDWFLLFARRLVKWWMSASLQPRHNILVRIKMATWRSVCADEHQWAETTRWSTPQCRISMFF